VWLKGSNAYENDLKSPHILCLLVFLSSSCNYHLLDVQMSTHVFCYIY